MVVTMCLKKEKKEEVLLAIYTDADQHLTSGSLVLYNCLLFVHDQVYDLDVDIQIVCVCV